jgi:hypothetical protein
MEWWHWVLLALPILPNLWSIWHANAHRFANPVERVLWLAACIFVPCLGGLAYVFFARPRALKDENS